MPESSPNRAAGLIYLGLSLDGRIAGPNHDVSFLDPYQDPSLGDLGFGAFMASIDALVMGRSTWEVVQSFDGWFYGDTPIYVRTTRPLTGATHGEQPVSGPMTRLLQDLHAQGHRRVYIDGGKTVQDALVEDVADEMTLTIVPELLGEGPVLFAEGLPRSRWTRTHVTTREDGPVQVCWTRRR
ncbi:MAG: dihydrofolate reductase family protein [Myxococcota bacterium]